MRRNAILISTGLVLSGIAGWFFYPVHANLREFDAPRVGEAEAVMWKHYYEPRHALLALDVYRVARRAYGLSPADSLRMTWHAARAATLYYGNKDSERHRAAEAHLTSHYRIIAGHLPDVAPAEAARLELLWWQQHRARQYEACVKTLATLDSAIYGGQAERYEAAAKSRVEAMKLCDNRKKVPHPDVLWADIRSRLIESYDFLKQAVAVDPQDTARRESGI